MPAGDTDPIIIEIIVGAILNVEGKVKALLLAVPIRNQNATFDDLQFFADIDFDFEPDGSVSGTTAVASPSSGLMSLLSDVFRNTNGLLSGPSIEILPLEQHCEQADM